MIAHARRGSIAIFAMNGSGQHVARQGEQSRLKVASGGGADTRRVRRGVLHPYSARPNPLVSLPARRLGADFSARAWWRPAMIHKSTLASLSEPRSYWSLRCGEEIGLNLEKFTHEWLPVLHEWLPVLAAAVVVVGWWVGHWSAAKRDVANDRRKQRIEFLINAYRKIEVMAGRTNPGTEHNDNIETAISDIQLLGSIHQASLARQFAEDFSRSGAADIEDLLLNLRKTLRDELALDPITDRIIHLRIVDKECSTGSQPP
jgi:hypothetical protein